MALRTRSAIDGLVAEMIDDPDNQRWSAANLKAIISMVYDQLWGEMLEIASWLLSTTESETSLTSPGYLDVGNGGDLSNRLFRIQKVVRDDKEYTKAQPTSVSIDSANSEIIYAPDYTYFFFGSHLYLFPLDTTTDVDVTYSYYPPEYEDLGDAAEITWPQGHDLALVLEAAATLLIRGGAEDPSGILALAERAKQRMFSAIKRRELGPLFVHGNTMYDNREFGGIQ